MGVIFEKVLRSRARKTPSGFLENETLAIKAFLKQNITTIKLPVFYHNTTGILPLFFLNPKTFII